MGTVPVVRSNGLSCISAVVPYLTMGTVPRVRFWFAANKEPQSSCPAVLLFNIYFLYFLLLNQFFCILANVHGLKGSYGLNGQRKHS